MTRLTATAFASSGNLLKVIFFTSLTTVQSSALFDRPGDMKQCAAVSTQLGAISEPPQMKPTPWSPSRMNRPTCQGHSFCVVQVPPMMRVVQASPSLTRAGAKPRSASEISAPCAPPRGISAAPTSASDEAAERIRVFMTFS